MESTKLAWDKLFKDNELNTMSNKLTSWTSGPNAPWTEILSHTSGSTVLPRSERD